MQPYSGGLEGILGECLNTTYNAIHYAEEHGIDNRREMKGFYQSLKDTKLPSCYKVAVIARACQVLGSRKKSDKRGTRLRYPKPLKPVVCITSGFFITMKGRLFIPLRRDEYFDVQLGHYVMETAEGKKMRSLTVTPSSLSLCYSDDVKVAPAETVYGADRNEKNLTFGDSERVIQVDMTKVIKVKQMTREVVGSFKRNDARVRSHLARKYWRRGFYRTNSLLHAATNFVIETASRQSRHRHRRPDRHQQDVPKR